MQCDDFAGSIYLLSHHAHTFLTFGQSSATLSSILFRKRAVMLSTYLMMPHIITFFSRDEDAMAFLMRYLLFRDGGRSPML